MAAVGVALRTLQEWVGHRDFKTTLIYSDYQPGEHEAELVEQAFGQGSKRGSKLSESEPTSSALRWRERAQTEVSGPPSRWLWSRRSPVRIRSLTLNRSVPGEGLTRRVGHLCSELCRNAEGQAPDSLPEILRCIGQLAFDRLSPFPEVLPPLVVDWYDRVGSNQPAQLYGLTGGHRVVHGT